MVASSFQISINAAIWTLISRWLQRLLGLASTLILVRLLNPDDFGISAISTFIIFLAMAMTRAGPRLYIIREKEINREQLDSIWSLNFLLKFVSGLLMVVAAYPVSIFAGDERLVSVILASSLIPFMLCFRNVSLDLLEKRGRYRAISMIPVYGRLLSVPLTLGLAFWLKNYWALIIGSVFAFGVQIISGYIVSPYKPRFSTKYWREQWDFSKWAFASGVTSYCRQKVDTMIVGYQFGTSGTGLYNMAREFGALPANEIVLPANRGFYSAIAKNRDNYPALTDQFIKQLFLNLTIIIPSVFGYFFIEDLFVKVVLGDKWLPISEFLGIASAMMIPMTLYSLIVEVFTLCTNLKAIIVADVSYLVVLVSIFLLVPFTEIDQFVFLRLALGVTFTGLLLLFYKQFLGVNILRRMGWILVLFLISSIMIFVLEVLSFFVGGFSDIAKLAIYVFVGGIAYVLLLTWSTKKLKRRYQEFRLLNNLVSKIFSKLRNAIQVIL